MPNQPPPTSLPTKAMLIHMLDDTYVVPDNFGKDTEEGDEIQLYYLDPPQSTYAIKWTLQRDPATGAVHIRSQNSERYLSAETVADGKPPKLRKTLGSNMLWDFVPIPGVSDAAGSPLIRAIVPHNNTDYALGAAGMAMPATDTYITYSRMWGGFPSWMHAFAIVPVS
jgi:hypothetical protein